MTRLLLAGLPHHDAALRDPGGALVGGRAADDHHRFDELREQGIVSNLYGDVLSHAGYTVTVEPALGTRAVVVPALEQGQLDLEPTTRPPSSRS